MKVRILTSIAGARFAYQPGQILDVTDAEPDVRAWLTVPLADGTFRAEVLEEAVTGPPETAARRRSGKEQRR